MKVNFKALAVVISFTAVLGLGQILIGLRNPLPASALSMTLNSIASTPYKQHRVFLKAATGPANNAETNILNLSSGSGVVKYIWLADRPGSGGGYPEFDHSIRIYTDGNSTANVDTDLGMFFGYAGGDAFPAGNIQTAHWNARVGGSAHLDRTGGSLSLVIPFHNGIRIAVANTNNTAVSSVFSQVDYALASENSDLTVPSYTLYVAGNKWQGSRGSVNAGSDATLATIPSGNQGVIIGDSMAGIDTTDYSYLERELALKVDGESTASIQSSGTEDWFGGSDYFFTGQSPYSQSGAMGFGAANNSNNSFSALVDFGAGNGGYVFNSSATLTWLAHSANTSTASYANALFYYRQN